MLVKLEEKPKHGSIVAYTLEKKVTALSDYSMSRYQSSTTNLLWKQLIVTEIH